MTVVCSHCGAKNGIPDLPQEGKIYRCWKCKTVVIPRVKKVDPNQESSIDILAGHGARTADDRSLVLGILLLLCSAALLLAVTGGAAMEKASLNSREGIDLVMYPNDILRNVASPIENIGEDDSQLALLLENTMLRLKAPGLSAPQVGVSKRMSVVKLVRPASSDEVIRMINPEVIERAGSTTEFEGCLSLPRGDRKIEVTRSEEILVRFLTLEAKETVLEERGMNARVIQHEIDHLNGILVVDYAKDSRMAPTILAAIIVYSIAACAAVAIYMLNRRKRKVVD